MARLAPTLQKLRQTVDLRWPGRDRASDGWIGDKEHQARQSDHNPNGRDVVDALDLDTVGGATPVHVPSVVAAGMIHPATHYIIHAGRIYNREDRFRPRVYTGTNKHTVHCHLSALQSVAAENETDGWSLVEGVPSWETMAKGATGYAVLQLQAMLNAWGSSLVVDGDFGALTDTAVRRFQQNHGLVVDGIVGPRTHGALFA